jgi:hypothetical protein
MERRRGAARAVTDDITNSREITVRNGRHCIRAACFNAVRYLWHDSFVL